MAKDSANFEFYRYQVGAKVPNISAPIPDGIHFEFDGHFTLTCVYSRPTAAEKMAFKNGVPQFDLIVVDDVIFFLARFGKLNWMDLPFNIHLYRDNRAALLEVPGPTQGYGLLVMLIDGVTGTLVNLRLIGLNHDLSMRLRDAIIHQPMIPNYDQRLQSVMAQYTTKDLVALANSRPTSAAQNDMATSMPQLRPSHRGIIGVKKDNYPLPEELRDFNYFYSNGTGHVVMAIPESLLPQAIKSGNFDGYECPIPCRYILAKGYRFHEVYVVCDVPYDKVFGVNVDEFWYDE